MAIETILRRMNIQDATVHGFRSSFLDWAGNVSYFPREVGETALAHVIGDKAEQAYRRSDAPEKRRKLMEAWAAYCEPGRSNKYRTINKSETLRIQISNEAQSTMDSGLLATAVAARGKYHSLSVLLNENASGLMSFFKILRAL
jgi:hypothetical protein